MSDDFNPVGHTMTSWRPAGSVAYVVIPDDMDRATYVQACRLTGRISVLTVEGEYIHHVPVALAAWADLHFPAELGGRGSCLALLGMAHAANRPVVVGVLPRPDEPGGGADEYSFALSRSEPGGHVGLVGRADTADLVLTAQGNQAGTGSMRLLVSNPGQDAVLEAHVNGSAEILAARQLRLEAGERLELLVDDHRGDIPQAALTYDPSQGLRYADHQGNVLEAGDGFFRFQSRDGQVIESSATINLGTAGGAAQPALLGNATTDFLEELIGIIRRLTFNTNVGPSYPMAINDPEFEPLLKKLATLKSQSVTLD